ncbi:MAG: tetratricopeptide repeat protein [Candidatus Omnitrophota bacterium]
MKKIGIGSVLVCSVFLCLLALSAFASESGTYYKEGYEYCISGEYEKAILSLQKAIELQPNYADAYFQLGEVYAHLGDNQKAEQNYLQAKQLYIEEGNQRQAKRIDEISRVKSMLRKVENSMIKPNKTIAVKIVSPREGDVFHPGDTVHVKVDADRGVTMVLIGAGAYASALDTEPPFELVFTIPGNASPSQLEISAGGRDGSGQSFGSDEINVSIK